MNYLELTDEDPGDAPAYAPPPPPTDTDAFMEVDLGSGSSSNVRSQNQVSRNPRRRSINNDPPQSSTVTEQVNYTSNPISSSNSGSGIRGFVRSIPLLGRLSNSDQGSSSRVPVTHTVTEDPLNAVTTGEHRDSELNEYALPVGAERVEVNIAPLPDYLWRQPEPIIEEPSPISVVGNGGISQTYNQTSTDAQEENAQETTAEDETPRTQIVKVVQIVVLQEPPPIAMFLWIAGFYLG